MPADRTPDKGEEWARAEFPGQWPGAAEFTPIGYQGPAQHTFTRFCDGFHEPGQCTTPPSRAEHLPG